MGAIVVFLAAIVFTTLVLLVFKSKPELAVDKFLKITTLIFCSMMLFKFMLSDSFVFVINGAVFNGVYYDKTDILQTVLRWGYYLNVVVLPMAIFFNSRLFKNILSYVCLPFSILSAVFFNDYMAYYLSAQGPGLHFAAWFRYIYFGIELVLAISLPIITQIKHKHVFNVKDKWEWIRFLIVLPFVILLMMPPYVPQSIIGYSRFLPEIGSGYHITWICLTLLMILSLFCIFRFINLYTFVLT